MSSHCFQKNLVFRQALSVNSLGFVTGTSTVSAEVQPGETTNKGLNVGGGKYVDFVYLAKPNGQNLEQIAYKPGMYIGDNKFWPRFKPSNGDYTFVLTKNDGKWSIETRRSK